VDADAGVEPGAVGHDCADRQGGAIFGDGAVARMLLAAAEQRMGEMKTEPLFERDGGCEREGCV